MTGAGRLAFAVLASTVLAPVMLPGAASAHPLGNFSVNQYVGLTLSPGQVRVAAVLNTAEIPTRQDRTLVDADHDGTVTDRESAGHAAKACAELAASLIVRAGADRLTWTVEPGPYEYAPGAAGLATARLSCALSAPAALATATTVTVANQYLAGRVGWHEMTATGDGVRLLDSPLPARSISEELRAYPPVPDPSSVLDVRTATLRVTPGSGGPVATGPRLPAGSGPLTAATIWAERGFEGLAAGRLTPLLAVLAVLVAVLLGAGHALLPGHGKTVLAVYLAGRAGRPRDALAVGATVTATHTGGVLLGGLLLSTVTGLAGDRLLIALGLASGILITIVGVSMCLGIARRRTPTHDHVHHSHDHVHAHGHTHAGPRGRLGLAGIGIAGGLVPSPSALVVLLAAVGLGRAVFGVLLVIAYGLGMAATLTAAGLLLVTVQRRAGTRLSRLAGPLRRFMPAVSAGLVVVIGVALAARAAIGLG